MWTAQNADKMVTRYNATPVDALFYKVKKSHSGKNLENLSFWKIRAEFHEKTEF